MKRRLMCAALAFAVGTACVSVRAVPAAPPDAVCEVPDECEIAEAGPEGEDAVIETEPDAAGAAMDVSAPGVQEMVQDAFAWMRGRKTNIMDAAFLRSVSGTDTDWTAFDIGRQGVADDWDGFLAAAALHVQEKYRQHPQWGLSDDPLTSTEFHRLSMALLALGGDPTDIGGHDLIADGTYGCLLGAPWVQGTNGAAWALIALDAGGYETPDGAAYDRQALIEYLLSAQLADGGWPLVTAGSSPDMGGGEMDVTGMAVTALAPYCAGDARVREAVGRGLERLRSAMWSAGYLGTCESTAWAVTANCSAGADPAAVTPAGSGKSLFWDGLVHYRQADGGFAHGRTSKSSDHMATDQAVYAMTAYERFLAGDTNLFDFRAPADTAYYRVTVDGTPYFADAGSDVLELPLGTQSMSIVNLPVGNYEAGEVVLGGDTWKTSYRRADGSTPVAGEIPVTDGMQLTIRTLYRDGTSGERKLTVKLAESAAAAAVEQQIGALPEADALTIGDREAVLAAKDAYDALPEAEKASVGNRAKLEELLARMDELSAEEEKTLSERRAELEEKVKRLPAKARISDKLTVKQYLSELEKLGEWEGKAALLSFLQEHMEQIEAREALISALDEDIWDRVDPLRVTQKSAPVVNALMKRYNALTADERELLENGESLVRAKGIVDSLADGVIPAEVFANLLATKEKFIYTGKLSDGTAYTLTYAGKDVQAVGDVDARAEVKKRSKKVAGEALQVRFLQKGSMNGTPTFSVRRDLQKGSYHSYWYNAEKKVLQKASDAKVQGKKLTMQAPMGGRYWLSKGTVYLGSAPKAAPKAAAAPTSRTGGTAQPSAVRTPGNTVAAGGASSGSSAAVQETSNTATAETKDGVVKAAEFAKIKGKDQNLKVPGTLADGTDYTFTFHGEDIVKEQDFHHQIAQDCGNSRYIRELAEDPLILCMEEMSFPGKALLSLDTELADGTYLLFRYDAEEMRAEYVRRLAARDGKVQFTLEEGGDYFVAVRAKAGSLRDDGTEETETAGAALGSSFDAAEPEMLAAAAVPAAAGVQGKGGIWKYLLTFLLGAGASGGGICLYRKKKEGENDGKES